MKLYRVKEAFYDDYHGGWVYEGAVFAMPDKPYKEQFEELSVPSTRQLDQAEAAGYMMAVRDVASWMRAEGMGITADLLERTFGTRSES